MIHLECQHQRLHHICLIEVATLFWSDSFGLLRNCGINADAQCKRALTFKISLTLGVPSQWHTCCTTINDGYDILCQEVGVIYCCERQVARYVAAEFLVSLM